MKLRTTLVCASLALGLSVAAPAREPSVGRTAPNCALTSLSSAQPRELREFRGKVVWVDFWASWCGSCAESFPFLDDLDSALRDRGLQVLGVNVDEVPADASEFLARHPVEFVQLADGTGTCPREFRVEGMPSSFLIDRDGVIRHEHRGFRPGDAAALRSLVETLLAETPASPG